MSYERLPLRFPKTYPERRFFDEAHPELVDLWRKDALKLERWETAPFKYRSGGTLWLPVSTQFYVDFAMKHFGPASVPSKVVVDRPAGNKYRVRIEDWTGRHMSVECEVLVHGYVLLATDVYNARGTRA